MSQPPQIPPPPPPGRPAHPSQQYAAARRGPMASPPGERRAWHDNVLVGALAALLLLGWAMLIELATAFVTDGFGSDPLITPLFDLPIYLALVAVLPVISRPGWRRLLAPVTALAAYLAWLLYFFSLDSFLSAGAESARLAMVVLPALSQLLVLTAWGLARRRGRWWPLGLLPALVVVVLAQIGISTAIYFALDSDALVMTSTLAGLLSYLALALGGLCCWGVEALEGRRGTAA